MDDYINREDALKLCRDGKLLSSNAFEKLAIKYIADIPSADVRPMKHGKWIESNPQNSKICRLIKCSKCGNCYIVNINVPYVDWISSRNRKYCGCCGAYMRGKK